MIHYAANLLGVGRSAASPLDVRKGFAFPSPFNRDFCWGSASARRSRRSLFEDQEQRSTERPSLSAHRGGKTTRRAAL